MDRVKHNDAPPQKPSDTIKRNIAAMEQYMRQMQVRGAPPSELHAQAERIAQEYLKLKMAQD
jgi:hypothetical protein